MIPSMPERVPPMSGVADMASRYAMAAGIVAFAIWISLPKKKRKNPSKRRWIKGAIKHPGALRATVRRRYGDAGFTARGTIKAGVLSELAKTPGVTGKRARLARTLRGFR